MTSDQWVLISTLAIGTFSLRFAGLLAGDAIERRPRLRAILRDLPGCLVVALVAASLTGAESAAWLAAAVALAAAAWTNHIIATMILGTLAFVALQAVWLG